MIGRSQPYRKWRPALALGKWMKEEWKMKDKPDKWKLAGSQIPLSVKRPTLHCLCKKRPNADA